MIEYFGIENIIYSILVVLAFAGFQIDRFSRHSLRHIDKLQERVDELEKRVGIK